MLEARSAPLDIQSLEDIEVKLLLEAVSLRYGYDFREYAAAPLRRSITTGMAGEGVSTISAYQDRLLHDQPDRLEVGVRLVGEVGIKRYRNRVGSQMPDLDGVTIRTGAHSPQRTGGAAGACDILHDNLLPERARHMIADDPGRDVARTPSRERRDHLDGPRRPLGRARRSSG